MEPPRTLHFETYADAIAEIERLQRDGYEQHGRWSLGQMCAHLSFYYRGSLNGFGFMLPWIVRVLLGRRLLRRFLTRGMSYGMPTTRRSAPPTEVEDQAAAHESLELLHRLAAHDGPLHASPLAGAMTVDEWRRLHLVHTAHHLSLLTPREPAARRPASIP